jgi:NAD(P)-dependent dehydrogenase (short-subunit alcohol dehydrogenase family)
MHFAAECVCLSFVGVCEGKRRMAQEMSDSPNAMRLRGKVAIITGAASGIGRASTLLFAREGGKVVAIDRATAPLKQLTAETEEGSVLAIDADVGEETAVKAYVDRTLEVFGKVDVVFANAGISGGFPPLLDQTAASWTEVLRINLIGPFLAIKYASPHMTAAGGGSIIMTASVGALRANAGGNAYSASKAGVVSLAQTAAASLAGTGVRVNAICPGLIETGMTQSLFEKARQRGTQDQIGQLNPLRRAGLPQEVAALALFLASDEASYINGQAFAVDGGLSSTHPFALPGKR